MTMRNLTVFCAVLAGAAFAQTDPPKPATIPDWVEIERNLPYDTHRETVIDVMWPKAATKEKRPGAIVIHGGGWRAGTKEQMVTSHCLPYLEKGFVVANVEYRLAKTATAPAAVTDALNATRWFKRNAKKYNVDDKRIVVTGTSAGGHLSLMVGMTPGSAKLGPSGDVAAVVNFYGITDVWDQAQGANQREYAVAWLPEATEGRMELARRVSPITYVRKDVPAILTIHGDADATVPYEHGVALTKALRESGADAEMINVPQGAHGFPPEKLKAIYSQIFEFLERRKIVR
jgi:acetyl esterase/lipase